MSIIRRKKDIPVENKKMFGGAGEAENHKILLGAEEMAGKGRLFNHVVLRPGCEIAWHIHHGDCKTYYILKGYGEYNNNGEVTTVGPGDMTRVNPEEGHGMKTLGEEPLEMIALVLYV